MANMIRAVFQNPLDSNQTFVRPTSKTSEYIYFPVRRIYKMNDRYCNGPEMDKMLIHTYRLTFHEKHRVYYEYLGV